MPAYKSRNPVPNLRRYPCWEGLKYPIGPDFEINGEVFCLVCDMSTTNDGSDMLLIKFGGFKGETVKSCYSSEQANEFLDLVEKAGSFHRVFVSMMDKNEEFIQFLFKGIKVGWFRRSEKARDIIDSSSSCNSLQELEEMTCQDWYKGEVSIFSVCGFVSFQKYARKLTTTNNDLTSEGERWVSLIEESDNPHNLFDEWWQAGHSSTLFFYWVEWFKKIS